MDNAWLLPSLFSLQHFASLDFDFSTVCLKAFLKRWSGGRLSTSHDTAWWRGNNARSPEHMNSLCLLNALLPPHSYMADDAVRY